MDEPSDIAKSPQKLTDDELEDWKKDMEEESLEELDSDIDNDDEDNMLSMQNRKKRLKKEERLNFDFKIEGVSK